MNEEVKTGEIILYKANDGTTEIDVKFENDTVRLSQKQMAILFDKDSDTIWKHIKNVFQEKELDQKQTTAYFAVVQKEWWKLVKRSIIYYNLDVIISVWYRVKSLRGTQFRIRATQRLKDYLLTWYALNTKRLEETKLDQLEQVVALIKKNIDHAELSHQETTGLLNVITHYTHSWILLQKYDEGSLTLPDGKYKLTAELTYQEAIKAINDMRTNFLFQNYVSELFGIERNNEFKWDAMKTWNFSEGFHDVEVMPTTLDASTLNEM